MNLWDEFLVRGLLNDEPGRRLLLRHLILARLAEVAPQPSGVVNETADGSPGRSSE